MNRELLTQIAVWLEGGAKHEKMVFSMSTGVSFEPVDFNPKAVAECQSSCCIAGAAVQFSGLTQSIADRLDMDEQDSPELPWWRVRQAATAALGITDAQGRALFDPAHYDNEGIAWKNGELVEFNDPSWAARVIRRFLAIGLIDWNGTRPSVY